MRKNEFVKQLAEFCEFENEDLTLNTSLETIDDYDSMAIMTMIAFIDENFNMKITAQMLQDITDFNSIIDLIGSDKFDND